MHRGIAAFERRRPRSNGDSTGTSTQVESWRCWMRRVLASATWIWLAVSLTRAAHAQVITGEIVGNVRDESGGVLPGVTVTLASAELASGPASTVTNGQGEYRFINLRPGGYTITMSIQGFATYQEQGL